jgi:ankyrin repeat protein
MTETGVRRREAERYRKQQEQMEKARAEEKAARAAEAAEKKAIYDKVSKEVQAEFAEKWRKEDEEKARQARKTYLNTLDEDGMALLHSLSRTGIGKLAEIIEDVEAGADVNLRAKNGFTPLHFAAEAGHLDIVQYLLDHGADVNAREPSGFTPLHLASLAGHAAVVQTLLEKGANPNALAGPTRAPPLIAAVEKGHLDVARILVDRDADMRITVQGPDGRSYTPIDFAQVRRSEAEAAGDKAREELFNSMYKFFLRRRSDLREGVMPLHIASEKGDVATVLSLIRMGKNVNVRDTYGYTPLHFASKNGRSNVVKVLLDAGARTDLLTEKRETPLDLARKSGDEATVALLDSSAPVQTTGRAATHYKLSKGGRKTVRRRRSSLPTRKGPSSGRSQRYTRRRPKSRS